MVISIIKPLKIFSVLHFPRSLPLVSLTPPFCNFIRIFSALLFPTAEEPGRGARAFTRDPSQLQGTILQTALRKSPQGFGFTIIGGDRPDEFLQVKNVLPDGPAAHDNKMASGNLPLRLLPAAQTHPGVTLRGGEDLRGRRTEPFHRRRIHLLAATFVLATCHHYAAVGGRL